jgi:cbb3-type cytochrome oxidase cytochrome c subunit
MKTEKPKYKILEENKEDVKQSKILVSGLIREISIPNIEHDIEYYKNAVKGNEAVIGVTEQQMNIALKEKPEIREMSDELLEACFYYLQRKKELNILRNKVKDDKEQVEYLERMLKDIEEQTGIKI